MITTDFDDGLADLYARWIPKDTTETFHYQLADDLFVVVYSVDHFDETTWHVIRFFKLNGEWAVSADLETQDLTKVLAELQDIVRIG